VFYDIVMYKTEVNFISRNIILETKAYIENRLMLSSYPLNNAVLLMQLV